MLQRAEDRFPRITKSQELIMLCVEGGKAARPMLKWLVPFQV